MFTGINPNITFPLMHMANVQEGGLRLKNQTLDFTLFSKKSFTICGLPGSCICLLQKKQFNGIIILGQ